MEMIITDELKDKIRQLVKPMVIAKLQEDGRYDDIKDTLTIGTTDEELEMYEGSKSIFVNCGCVDGLFVVELEPEYIKNFTVKKLSEEIDTDIANEE